MGKGSQTNETGAVKLSKKQLIRLKEKKKRNKKILTGIIAGVIAVAIVAAIIITSIPNVPDLEGQLVAKNEFFEIDGAMFAYMVYDYVQQYGSYMASSGYNTSLGLLEQTTNYTSSGTSMTWYKYFCGLAQDMLSEYMAFASAELAKEENKGKTIDQVLTDEDKADVEEFVKTLKDYSVQNGYGNVNKFLNAVYTPGVTINAVKRVYEIQLLAYAYVEEYLDGLEYTDEEIEKYKEENPGSFLMLDYVAYTFSPTYEKDAKDDVKKAAYEKAKADAEAFMDKYTTVLDFKKGILAIENVTDNKTNTEETGAPETNAPETNAPETNAPETNAPETDAPSTAEFKEFTEAEEKILKDFIFTGKLYDETKAEADATKAYYEWAYSTDRKVNDRYILETKASNGDLSYTVYIIEKPVYIDDYATKNVRHILFDIDTSLTGTAQEKAYEEAKAEAEKVLEEYNKGDKTAESFGELAKEHTADTNGDEGGLYENIGKGKMVEEFENWIYDENRKEGDVDLVKTKYGWHLMYFVGDGDLMWKTTAESELKDEDYQDHLDELADAYALTYDYEAMFVSLGGEM